MKTFYTGVPDKLLKKWLQGKEYLISSDEGEAVCIGAGYYLVTKKCATVFMSADGFCNALNAITSYVIPEKIKMNIVVSAGRVEPQHIIMTKILPAIIKLIKSHAKGISIKVIKGK